MENTMPKDPLNDDDWNSNDDQIAALKDQVHDLATKAANLLPYAEQEYESLRECNKRDGDCAKEMKAAAKAIKEARAAIEATEPSYKCQACGREELTCSMNPCEAVLADRQA